MSRLITASLLVVFSFVATASDAAARPPRLGVVNRAVRTYQRDVRQLQRTTSRSYNQISRDFSRTIRQAPRARAYGPRPVSSGIYLGSPRGGIYFRF